MKNNWLFRVGFYLILTLPLFSLAPWFYPPEFGKTIIFRSVMTILLVLFAWQFLYQRESLPLPPVKKNLLVWLLLALLGAFILATVFSQDPYFSLFGSPLRAGGVVNLIFYIILAILSFFILTGKDWQKVWDVSFMVGAAVALLGIVQFYQPIGRPYSTMGNPIFLAMYLCLLLFMAVGFGIPEPNRTKKNRYFLGAGLFFVVILMTATRAVFLGMVIAGLYFLLFYNKKFLRLKMTAFLLVVLVGLSLFYVVTANHIPQSLQNNQFTNSIIQRISLKSITSDERTDAWQIAFNAFKSKPILGFGPENFQIAFDQFYNPKTIPYDRSVAFSNWWDRAHNIFLDIAVQTGIVGLLAYISLFGFLLFKLQQAKKNHENRFIKIHGMQTALIAYAVANFFSFDSFATYLLYFLLIGYSMHLIYEQQA